MAIVIEEAVHNAAVYYQKMIRIVEPKSSDAGIISEIGRYAFRHAFEHLFFNREELQQYLDYTYDIAKLSASLQKENNTYFLAMLNEQPVGFAKVKRYSLNQQIDSFAQTELQKIYVLPGYHGSGAAHVLLQEVIKLAREVQADQLWLDTHISNARAIRFYEKHGFKKHDKYFFTIGTQQFEYDLMTLLIKSKVKNQNSKVQQHLI